MIAFSLATTSRRLRLDLRVLRLTEAAAGYLPASWAEEVARTVAGWIEDDVTAASVRRALVHRRTWFGLRVEDAAADECAAAMVAVWRDGR